MLFNEMLPWLIIALLIGMIAGLIVGTYVGSSLLHRHEKVARSQPQPMMYQRAPTRYLDDDPYGVGKPRR